MKIKNILFIVFMCSVLANLSLAEESVTGDQTVELNSENPVESATPWKFTPPVKDLAKLPEKAKEFISNMESAFNKCAPGCKVTKYLYFADASMMRKKSCFNSLQAANFMDVRCEDKTFTISKDRKYFHKLAECMKSDKLNTKGPPKYNYFYVGAKNCTPTMSKQFKIDNSSF